MRTPSALIVLVVCLLACTVLVVGQSDPTGGGLDPATTPAPLPTRAPRPAPFNILSGEGITAEVYFESLPQGETRLIRVYGRSAAGSPLSEVRARFLGEDLLIAFYTISADENPMLSGFWGILAAGMEQRTGPGELIVYGTYADGTTTSLTAAIPITLGGFITQDVVVPPDRTYLLDTETERTELARLASVYSTVTPERRWDADGFMLPIPAALTSPFGAFRTFNATLSTRHTGWDIRSTLGQPVMATAAGVVVYAGFQEIRGDYVLVDHGYGVFSGYAHLATTHVTRGQQVTRGQVIGTVGESGRVSGPHFHWEMAVNGQWIDSVTFLEMWQP